MSKLYYTNGNGKFYVNLKDVAAYPSLNDKVKRVTVFNPKTKQEEIKNRYETTWIDGILERVSLREDAKFTETGGKELSIHILDANGVTHIVKFEPFWGFENKTTGTTYEYITSSFFKSIARSIGQLKKGDLVSISINHTLVQTTKDGKERTTGNGDPLYVELISFFTKPDDKWNYVRGFEAPKFERNEVETGKDPFGNVKKTISGAEEMAYYWNIVKDFVDKEFPYNPSNSGETAMQQAPPAPSVSESAKPVEQEVVANVSTAKLEIDENDDLPF